MWQFLFGFGTGAYFATYYDLKPAMDKMTEYVKYNFPEKDEKNKKKD